MDHPLTSSSWRHDCLHTRESDGQDTSCLLVYAPAARWARQLTEKVVDEDDPRHSLFSLNGREHFGRVLESDRTFTKRVTDSEEVDEEHDGSNSAGSASRVVEKRKTRSK